MKKLEQDNKILAELDRKRLHKDNCSIQVLLPNQQSTQNHLPQLPCTCGVADPLHGTAQTTCCASQQGEFSQLGSFLNQPQTLAN